MPQVKIHVARALPEKSKRRLVEEVRELIPEVLGLDPRIGQVMLYESGFRANHATRDPNFVFVEVTMYSGRTGELKQKLAEAIISKITQYTGVDQSDINLVYYELSPDNYFGGISHRPGIGEAAEEA
ncbi:MAG: DUF1904 family protein [Firmicutes bacterium]|nr:DUF1904 family protein [Bacillota bacterium]